MSNVYVTVVSDVTSHYSGNVANKFKMKPQLRLPGDGWKVAIHSAVLPKMALFKDLQSKSVALITIYGKTEKPLAVDEWTKGEFKTSDLATMEKSESTVTGQGFFNNVIHKLEETSHANLSSGFLFSKDMARMAWDEKRPQPEIILSSSHASNILILEKTFSDKMGWTKTDDSGKTSLGTNLVPVYSSYAKGASSLSGGKEMILVSRNADVKLNAISDWRFMNLEQSFKEALNLHPRTLNVTAKVTADYYTTPQPLGQVYYAPRGRERYLFTPPVEEFYDVQTDHWDEIEISLKELDDSAVNFQSDSQCLIRLHFKKDQVHTAVNNNLVY